MGGGVSREASSGGVLSTKAPLRSNKPQSLPQKRDKEGVRGIEGSGKIVSSGGGRGMTTLQPPPASKQAKVRTTPSQSLVQAGGTTYYYSGQQVLVIYLS